MSEDIKHVARVVEQIAQDVKEIKEDVSALKVTAAVQQKDLENHIYRTELAEKAIQLLKDAVAPIQKHVTHVEGALKLLGALATGVGVIAGVVKILQLFV